MPAKLKIFILLGFTAFFGSMLVSASFYYSGKPVNLRDAMISGLLSPSDNPRGYRIASLGTALCGLLFLPVALVFYRSLVHRHRHLALTGSLLFALGPLCATTLLFYAADIDEVHVYLATSAYILMTGGLLICLALECSPIVGAGGWRGMALLLPLLSLLAILIFLVYLLFTPDYFDNKSLIRNVAFCEWTLCIIDAVCITVLAGMLSRPTR